MTIRKAVVQDLEEVLFIDHAVLETNWHEKLYIEEIYHQDAVFNVIHVEDDLAGFIIFRKSDDIYEILQFALLPRFQSKGLGSILFEHSIKDLKCEALFLEVSSTNSKAQAFYVKYGFESLRVRKNYYGPNEDAIVMRKRMI